MTGRLTILGGVFGAGLAAGHFLLPSPAPMPTPEPAPAVAAVPPPATAAAVAVAAKPPAEPTPSPGPVPPTDLFPADLGGEAVAAAVNPPAPVVPSPPATVAPKPRTSAAERGEVSSPTVYVALPADPLPAGRVVRPTPPPESVPADLGRGVEADPTAVKLAVPPTAPRFGPPAASPAAALLPPLTRQVPDRAPVTDPTAELAAGRVVQTELPLPAAAGWFLKLTVPDPFELGGQLRGKLGSDAEFGTSPPLVPVGKP